MSASSQPASWSPTISMSSGSPQPNPSSCASRMNLIDNGFMPISFAATVVFCLLVGLGTALVGSYYISWENAAAAGATAMLVVVLLGWVLTGLSLMVSASAMPHTVP